MSGLLPFGQLFVTSIPLLKSHGVRRRPFVRDLFCGSHGAVWPNASGMIAKKAKLKLAAFQRFSRRLISHVDPRKMCLTRIANPSRISRFGSIGNVSAKK
ncbi:hypothetical protein [Shimia sp.]|uniref:hypothetical protein n=1 Tax=Shimia sp. TaxID=1954381 RepID=UPI003296FB3A